MEVRHLDLLREIARRGSLVAVAAAAHRTPSALSQQLRTAERELGVKLVEPVSRGIRLTAAGQLLAEGAEDILQRIAELQARLEESAGSPRGQVRIGTLPSAGEALLPPLFRELAGTAIELDLDDFDLAEEDFAAQTLDADIVIGHSLTDDVPAGASELVSTLLVREPLDIALPEQHPLAERSSLSPEDVSRFTWLGVPQRYPFDSIPVAVEQLTGRSINRAVRLRDNRLVEALVAEGQGIALLPRFTTRPRPGVVLRPLTGVRAERAIVALSRPDRYTRLAVREVTDRLAAIGHQLTEDGKAAEAV
ncbi:LysR family transcriptional regulator [Nesterenkonia ebinurensis]|uniref:LysR family transcriptional regulator n=1 Tax=Nesterenkonia ebinurensis TaxID=2608252 RepID=UPI00123C85F2|nr:LysR family transcriptional regulator [Nesterenkonia ebinurensis]